MVVSAVRAIGQKNRNFYIELSSTIKPRQQQLIQHQLLSTVSGVNIFCIGTSDIALVLGRAPKEYSN